MKLVHVNKWSILQRKTQQKCYEIAEKNPATINML
jgi:hypothetical protein